jgi:hypothetical protein
MAASQGIYRIPPIAARKYGCLLSAPAIIQNGPRSMPSDLGPMTPGNIRANGVRTLAAWCLGRGCAAKMIPCFF